MLHIPEEIERKFRTLLNSLTDAHPGQCLVFNTLNETYVIAADSQEAAKAYSEKYGPLKSDEYWEMISNIIPKPKGRFS